MSSADLKWQQHATLVRITQNLRKTISPSSETVNHVVTRHYYPHLMQIRQRCHQGLLALEHILENWLESLC